MLLKSLLRRWLSKKEYVFGDLPISSGSFIHSMNTAKKSLDSEEDLEQKLVLLDFMIQVIKNDLTANSLATTFYDEHFFENHLSASFFPMFYYNQSGIKKSTYSLTKKGRRMVNLAEDCIFVTPWNTQKLQKTVTTLHHHNLEYLPETHFSTYYFPLGIWRIENGYHSISAGIGYKKGEILSKEIDITNSFPHITTDGTYWYNTHTRGRLSRVLDFRIAVIYEMTKLKAKLINETAESNSYP